MHARRWLSKAAMMSILLLALSAGCTSPSSSPSLPVEIPTVDLSRVPDGIYPGRALHRGFTYQVVTTVQEHRITGIQVLSNKNSRHGRKAEGVIPLIVAQQTPGVDGISGATYCSTGLKLAVADSLRTARSQKVTP